MSCRDRSKSPARAADLPPDLEPRGGRGTERQQLLGRHSLSQQLWEISTRRSDLQRRLRTPQPLKPVQVPQQRGSHPGRWCSLADGQLAGTARRACPLLPVGLPLASCQRELSQGAKSEQTASSHAGKWGAQPVSAPSLA